MGFPFFKKSIIQTTLFAAYSIALLISTFLFDTRIGYIKEIGSWIILGFIISSFYFYKKNKVKKNLTSIFSFESILPILFAFSIVTGDISFPKPAEIIQYRLVIRAVFFIFLLFHFTRIVRSRIDIFYLLGVLLIFTSLPVASESLTFQISSLVYSLFLLFRNQIIERTRDKIAILSFIFILALFASMLHSTLWFNSLKSVIRIISGIITLLVIRNSLESNPDGIKKVARILLVVIGITSAYSVYGVLSAYLIDGKFVPFLVKKEYLVGINTNDIGGLFTLIFPFVIIGAGIASDRKEKILFLSLAIITSSMILISWARTAIAMMILSLIIIIFISIIQMYYLKRRNILKYTTSYLSLFIILLALSTALSSSLSDFAWKKLLSTTTLSSRIALWGLTLASIIKYPLLGSGPGNSFHLLTIPYEDLPWEWVGQMTKKYSPSLSVSHSHNIMLQILLEGGLAVFIPFALLVSVILYRGVKFRSLNEKKSVLFKDWRFATTLSITVYLIHSITNYTLFLSPISMLFFSFLGISASRSHMDPPEDSDRREKQGSIRINPFNVILQITSLLLIFWVFTGFYFKEKVISVLRPYLSATGYMDSVLIPSDQSLLIKKDIPSYHISDEILDSAYSNTVSSLKYFRSQQMHSIAGDIQFIKYKRHSSINSLQKSAMHYLHCAETKGAPVYCLKRLKELTMLAKDEEINLTIPPLSNWRKRDPHKIIQNKNIKIQ